MTTDVVVLGAGYAGAGAVHRLEETLGPDADLTWVSETDYHLILHESHRCIRDPSVKDKVTIPVDEIKSRSTDFVQGEVVDLDVDERTVELADGTTIDYDYVLVGLGSQTAFYGIDGMEENALTLKSLDDALEIHDRVRAAAEQATRSDPAKVVVGGAGLSGIQTAGEVAEFRDEHRAPIDIYLVEALEEIFPGNDPEVQRALRKRLERAGVTILTDDPITGVDEEQLNFDKGDPLTYDVFVWTGGITGRDALDGADLDKEHNRVNTRANFQTNDERVFAIGDSAIIDQGETPAPPTAQAAWQAAEVVGENIARAIEGRPLKDWTYDDLGTVVSVGEEAVAHDVSYMGIGAPVTTFGGFPAKTLKKAIAAKWINSITGVGRAAKAWPDM